MTYVVEKVQPKEFASRLARMASTGEKLVSHAVLADGRREIVIDPPKVPPQRPSLPSGGSVPPALGGQS